MRQKDRWTPVIERHTKSTLGLVELLGCQQHVPQRKVIRTICARQSDRVDPMPRRLQKVDVVKHAVRFRRHAVIVSFCTAGSQTRGRCEATARRTVGAKQVTGRIGIWGIRNLFLRAARKR